MNALGVDVSRWQAALDWGLLRANGVSFAVIKSSQGAVGRDPLRKTHFKGAREAGLAAGVYHWLDPNHAERRQVENFLMAAAGLQFDFAALDVEQHWQSWTEWAEGRVNARISPDRISACALGAAEGIRRETGRPVVIYTRASFVHEYARPMLEWLPGWDLWLAHYPYPRGRRMLTWPELHAEHLPAQSGPGLPEGCREWRFWQFSGDRFVLPGARGPLDLDFYNGSEADLRAWCGLQPPAEPAGPTLVDPEKLRRLWQAHPELWA